MCGAFLLVVGAGAGAFAARVDRADFVPFGEAPRNDHVYLFVGADSGIERSPDDIQYAADGRARADVVLLVRLGDGGEVSAVSVPRDILVTHAGRLQRLAVTLLDGPGGVIEGICTGLGVSVDRYVQIDASGFADVVDALGGIDVELPTPLRDPAADLELTAGAQRLDGAQALALVRARHAESYVDGGWVPVSEAEGAQSRARSAAVVLDAVRERFAATDPATLLRTAWAGSDALTVGGGWHPGEWRRLAAADLHPVTLPVESSGAKWAVRLGDAGAAALHDAGFDTSCAGN
ncbi:LCP family protein [Leucobacter chironomi]|uniref:LCP family protein n=1 Tax=Leucobacter chironomi TaxID=491918 RepID=UPI000A0744FD|nr:LCP family protein [Leucobacter chironomi]